MNSWATVCLSKDEEDFKRVIQKKDVRMIQTIFETMQAQISNLKHCDHDAHGLEEQVSWTSGHWGKYSLLVTELLLNARHVKNSSRSREKGGLLWKEKR